MSVSLLEQVVAGRAPSLVPITVDQYHRMIATGVLHEGDPIELIDGFLVRKDRAATGGNPMSHGPQHARTVARLQRLDERVRVFHCHARSQLPVTLGGDQEPEPDLAVVRGSADDYSEHHPGPQDILATMEAADSSLSYDRTTKLRIYATANIAQYWLVNIPEQQLEVYEQPIPAEGRYARRTEFKLGQTVRLVIGATNAIEVPVAELLG